MAQLSREEVLKLAQLAKLELSEDELEQFSREISEILGYVEQLQRVNIAGLEPTYQVTGLKNVTRPDEVKDYGVTPKELLKNAPALQQNQFKVKRIFG